MTALHIPIQPRTFFPGDRVRHVNDYMTTGTVVAKSGKFIEVKLAGLTKTVTMLKDDVSIVA